jgi:hypothetical protein
MFKGDSWAGQFPPQYFIDVEDDAKLHVIALTDPKANGQRIFGFAAPFNWNDILAIFREAYPDKEFIEDFKDDSRDLSEVPNAEAERLLKEHYGKGWTSLKESVLNTVKTLA